jgi:hypothetical protein
MSRWLLTIICTVSLFSGAYGQQGSFQWEEIQKSMYDLASDGYEFKSAENKYVWEGGSLKSSFVTYYLQKGPSVVRCLEASTLPNALSCFTLVRPH